MGHWEEKWAAGVGKGDMWDAGQVEPAFAQLLKTATDLPKGRALVPGCGRGYAVAALARAGFEVVGLEISSSAVAVATGFLKEQTDLPAGSWTVELCDFFTLKPSTAPFDLIYDCTFLCAITPDMRQDWSSQMEALLAPAGELVTLIFPISDVAFEGGPPFCMSPDLVQGLLQPKGFQATTLEAVPEELFARKKLPYKEWLGRWRKASK